MTHECQSTLEFVVCDVFEKQAFMFGDPCDKAELDPDAEIYYHTTLAFEGPTKGGFELATTVNLSQELAANILGIEPDDEGIAEAGPDALKEILNIICGQFLTTAYGTEPVFRLSIPELREIGSADWDVLRGKPDSIGFTVDFGPALARVSVEESL